MENTKRFINGLQRVHYLPKNHKYAPCGKELKRQIPRDFAHTRIIKDVTCELCRRQIERNKKDNNESTKGNE